MRLLNWHELSKLGLVERINREICHPLGLAIGWDFSTNSSRGAIVASDGKWSYPDDMVSAVMSDVRKAIYVSGKLNSRYYFAPDDTPTHEDDWTDQQGESGDYWCYNFVDAELDLLDHYLNCEQSEVDRFCQALALGDVDKKGLYHALYAILLEYR